MSLLEQSLAGVVYGRPVVPEGLYRLKVGEVVRAPSSKAKLDMLTIRFDHVEDVEDRDKRRVAAGTGACYERIVIDGGQSDKAKEMNLQRLVGLRDACGVEREDFGDPQDYVGLDLQAKLKIRIEEGQDDQNEIGLYIPAKH